VTFRNRVQPFRKSEGFIWLCVTLVLHQASFKQAQVPISEVATRRCLPKSSNVAGSRTQKCSTWVRLAARVKQLHFTADFARIWNIVLACSADTGAGAIFGNLLTLEICGSTGQYIRMKNRHMLSHAC